MMRRLLVLYLLLLAAPASAALAPAALDGVALEPPPGAALPLDTLLQVGEQNASLRAILAARPAWLLVFADYTCAGVCGPALGIAASAFSSPDMQDLDAGLLVIGLDPKDTAADAARMRAETWGNAADPRAVFARTDEANVAKLTAAVGYRYRYDPETDQFAHPAAALSITREGRVVRPLGALALMPNTLRKALVEASGGHAGGLFERIALRCYSFDPARGVYTADIVLVLRALGVATLLGLALLLALLMRRTAGKEAA
ncbi:SCO family protein [Aureimonas sp. AU40]|uniref:SCO family protein n=1 Tax=Aureimonas sp. AU40 TaxID=1637747 RepID=UPI000A57FC72|nr:SCO family protein [Aureimonas sp. AU40]